MATIGWESDSDSESSFQIIESDEPRHLTKEEIDTIVNSLCYSYDHNPVQENLINIQRTKTRCALEKEKIKPSKIPELSRIIKREFFKSLVAPGEAVGVNSSQNIGEPTMQMTLNTFHHAGNSAKNGALGFHRVQEILNAAKKQGNPTITAYFKDSNQSPHELHKYSDRLAQANIDQLLIDWKVYDPEEYTFSFWQEAFMKLNPNFGDLCEDDWCLSFKFDLKKLYEHNITPKEIAKKLEKSYTDIRCIPSPRNLATVDVIIDCSQITFQGSQTLVLMEIEDDTASRKFYMEKIVSPKLRGTLACGVEGIEKIYPRQAKPDEIFAGFKLKEEIQKRIKHELEWIIDTDGTNLKEFLQQPGIDTERTISNDMWEIYDVFGIEATRAYIFIEYINILNSGGIDLNPVHIEVLVDRMCYTGNIRAITRFGVETSQYKPIARATFEEVMKQFTTSAIFSEADDLGGVSSNIVMGTRINVGTGHVKTKNIEVRVKKREEVVSEDI